jgi:DNA polymerase alpha subunit B
LEKKWQSLRRVILSHLQTQHQEDVSKESQQQDADVIDMTVEEIPVGIPQSSPHVTIGRICNEAHSGTLNAASMVLEGSKSRSNGARIHLDVSNLLSPPSDGTKKGLDGWSFFPGQMVALQGRNVTGRKMIVDQVVAEGAPPPPICKTLASQLMDYHHGMDHQNGSPLRVVVACGPFTTQDDLSYQPLFDLLLEVVRMNENEGGVDLVILMGPFVDVRQPLLMDGDKVVLEVDDGYDGRESKRQKMHVPYETLFANKVAGELFTLFEQQPHLPTQFVLVPSIDDAVAEPT